MTQLIRLRNDSAIPQIIYLGGGETRVVPRGTVLVPPGHAITRSDNFTRVGVVEIPSDDPPQDDTSALLQEIEELKRQLEATTVFPRHHRGGKWMLSDGTFTRGGISREVAEALEADLPNDEEA